VEITYTLKEYAASGNPEAKRIMQERERLASELQIKQALGETISDKEREQMLALERQAPDYDIADPFGGSAQLYRDSAAEIEKAIRRMLDGWRSEQALQRPMNELC